MISMTNGMLLNSAPSAGSVLTVAGTGGSHPTNAITLTGPNCQFQVSSADATLELNSIINGAGTLVKTGLGALTLDQSNSYTGNITVSAGTLNITYPDIAPKAIVTIGSNAVVNLNFANSETNTIAVLTLNGTNATPGLHNNGTDPNFITGAGSFLVIPPPPINPLPGTIQVSVSGSTLNLGWPTNAGWLLQAETNSLQHGLGTNWVTIPGSDAITNVSIPMSSTNGSTFYRMVHP
jgi:autotransporter-associated beta strand protein